MTEQEALRENAELLRGIENIPPTGSIPLPERQAFRARARAARGAGGNGEKNRPPVFFRRLLQVAGIVFHRRVGLAILPSSSRNREGRSRRHHRTG